MPVQAAALGGPRIVRVGAAAIAVDDDQPTFWDRVEAGRWEPGTLAAMGERLGPGAVLLDLGAWTGVLSLYGAALGATVIAVEADPEAFRQLRRNLAANSDLRGRVTAVQAAVAPEPGRIRLGVRRKPGDSMSSTLLGTRDVAWDADAVTPADLVRRFDAPARLLVTLDIEGGEYGLLPHLASLLDRPDAALLVSFHPAILREAGREPLAETRAALAPYRSWIARPVEPAGPGRPIILDEAGPDTERHDTWLLSRS